jgi:hypothetical protein
LSSVFIKKFPGNFFPGFLLLAPDQLARFPGCPAIDALLIHQLADAQCILFGGDSLADIDIVDTAGVPDSDVALPTQVAMEDSGHFLSGLNFDTLNADLPTGLIFYDLAIPEGQTAVFSDIADGADIDLTIGDVLHNFNSFLLEISSPFVTLVYHSRPDLSSVS